MKDPGDSWMIWLQEVNRVSISNSFWETPSLFDVLPMIPICLCYLCKSIPIKPTFV